MCLTPDALQSNVVYKRTCSRDVTMSYIGMTTRHLDIFVSFQSIKQSLKYCILYSTAYNKTTTATLLKIQRFSLRYYEVTSFCTQERKISCK